MASEQFSLGSGRRRDDFLMLYCPYVTGEKSDLTSLCLETVSVEEVVPMEVFLKQEFSEQVIEQVMMIQGTGTLADRYVY